MLRKKEIICCKADGKYSEFYATNNIKLVSSKNLGEYSLSLDNIFFRIYHSYFINLRYVEKIIKKDGLGCEISNGLVLPGAKRRQEEFIKFIKSIFQKNN
ncbi:MAG: two-component system LytT family response regulator [Flavobacterium sp.]